MAPLPTAEWNDALNRMSVAIDRALAELDRYRNEWVKVTDSPATTAPERLFMWLEQHLGQWDGKLDAAAELAASVEKQLEDRETAMERWHEVFVRWRELIQNTAFASSALPGEPCPTT
jgi:hypothetical protein